jgi:hypothetical protein
MDGSGGGGVVGKRREGGWGTHTNWVTNLAQEALLGLLLLVLRLVGGGDVVAALGLLICFVAGHAE